MKYQITTVLAAMAVGFFAQAIRAQAQAPAYTATLTGFTDGDATAINSSGEEVGYVQPPIQAAAWTGGANPTLLGGPTASYAYGVSDSGSVVGAENPDVGGQAIVWSGTTPTILGGLDNSESQQNQALGINPSGSLIVGQCIIGGQLGAVEWSGTTPTLLQSLSTSTYQNDCATAINNSGVAVGYSAPYTFENTPEIEEAVVWNGTTVTALSDLFSEALAINASGQIVGFEQIGGTDYAAEWKSGSGGYTPTIIGPANTEALGINDAGSVVVDGWNGNSGAYLYTNGDLYNLNTLNESPDIDIYQATGINDSGQIVANVTGTRGAYTSALLTPVAVPEPSPFAMLILAMPAFAGVQILRGKFRRG